MTIKSLFVSSLMGSALLVAPVLGLAQDQQADDTLATVNAFMGAMGSGDMEVLSALMADDMVWKNDGDQSLPWIGTWEGKEEIFKFLGSFTENVETTKWENEDVFASGDTAAIFGTMSVKTTKSGAQTDDFNFAARVKVEDGQIILWNWFEDSYAVSEAYHAE